MNKLEIKTAVDAAMRNDNVVDAREMKDIVAQVMVNGISPFEINAARDLLLDSRKEAAAIQHEINDLNAQIKQGQGILNPELWKRRLIAEAARTTAKNRIKAYQELSDTLYAKASKASRAIADLPGNVKKAGNDIADGFKGANYLNDMADKRLVHDPYPPTPSYNERAVEDAAHIRGMATKRLGDGFSQAFKDLFGQPENTPTPKQ